MDFNTEHYPPHCDQQCVRCKKLKNLGYFKRYYHSKTGRHLINLMQYRTTATCCECLDGMKVYNDERKMTQKDSVFYM